MEVTLGTRTYSFSRGGDSRSVRSVPISTEALSVSDHLHQARGVSSDRGTVLRVSSGGAARSVSHTSWGNTKLFVSGGLLMALLLTGCVTAPRVVVGPFSYWSLQSIERSRLVRQVEVEAPPSQDNFVKALTFAARPGEVAAGLGIDLAATPPATATEWGKQILAAALDIGLIYKLVDEVASHVKREHSTPSPVDVTVRSSDGTEVIVNCGGYK